MYKQTIDRLIREGYEFDMNRYIDRGYKIFSSKMGLFVGYAAIYFLISFIGTSSSVGLVSLVVRGPLIAGFFIVANAIVRNEPVTFARFFEGFKIFLPLFLAELISQIFTGIGFVLLILPGIYLAVAYSFAVPFVTFLNMDFWEAMETSRKLITRNFWPFLGFFVILTLINVFGAILLGVGLLFTFPATYCMVYAAFEDIVGNAIRDDEAKQQSQTDGTYYTYE
ncbi:MAG: hypothetical protein U9N51_02350 [Bacteroidota bacterium]|nr:hypothetical protein [Bacteroidota bacterium]